jgi:penicillin amidase
MAEILGRRALERDIGARLLRFRGDVERELRHYHPHGPDIIRSFARGINAYVALTEARPELLPPEFELLGIRPGRWTPEVVISRHAGWVQNVTEEVAYGRMVARLGAERVKEFVWFHPGDPEIALDPSIGEDDLFADILAAYRAARSPVEFRAEDLAAAGRVDPAESLERLEWAIGGAARAANGMADRTRPARPAASSSGRPGWIGPLAGSNNWVIGPERSRSGRPLMANDPHRRLAIPSLRYWVHLVGPGWNVIGGGEPAIPGVSIGHNEHGAWGLTIYSLDSEDLYVYEIHPSDPRRYRYGDGWEPMTVVRERIPLRGGDTATVELEFTRHGPVLHRDTAADRAYGLRAAWLEVGGAPYLASLRMDQARSWEEFREACRYSHVPAENMVWAGVDGTIGWQVVGIAPVRPTWDGLVPVPGDGRYEWAGYVPIEELPHASDPERGYLATANEARVPEGYPHRKAVGWTWEDPFRGDRLHEVLGAAGSLDLEDTKRLQQDRLSIPARRLVPLLRRVRGDAPAVERARRALLDWDLSLDPESPEAGIYVAWERRLRDRLRRILVPEEVRDELPWMSMKIVVDRLLEPDGRLLAPDDRSGRDPIRARDRIVLDELAAAVAELQDRLGPDLEDWRYGQRRYKHVLLRHPLSAALGSEHGADLDVGPAPRGGNWYTVDATGGSDDQRFGASFRIIAEVGDWDSALGTQTPGQSGDPGSPYYANLFDRWARGEYFPVLFSRERIEAVAEGVLVLEPAGG